ncbi:MAG: hypothetical protein FWH40_09415 [Coriobacteriia bacterium]|nr:hypothetical protein [Coriobacteriia bacterium]
MNNQLTHPSVERATIESVDGGWVSFVDPLRYPKSSFGDIKPYYAPICIDTLQGPESGFLKLPIDIYWGPERIFNLSHRSSLHSAYRTILAESDIEGLNQYINGEILKSIWDDLILPERLVDLWESKVEGLKNAR